MGRFSLRITILAWLLAIGLLPVIIVGAMGHYQARKSRLRDVTVELTAMTAHRLQDAMVLSDHLEKAVAHATVNTEIVSVLRAGGPEAAQRLDKMRQSWEVGEMWLMDSHGRPLAWSRPGHTWSRGQGTPPNQSTELGGLVRESLDRGIPLSRPFHGSRSGRSYLAQPIRNQAQEIEGLFVLSVKLSELLNSLGHTCSVPDGTRTYLVTESGLVVADLVTGAPFPVLREFSLPEAGQGSSVPLSRLGPQEGYLTITRPLEFLGQPYSLVTTLTQDQALVGLQSMDMGLAATTAVVAILATLVGLLIAHLLVDPLEVLSRNMLRVADGHEVLALPERGPKEIRKLTAVFRAMLGRLQEARELNDLQLTLKKNQVHLNEKLRGASSAQEMAPLALEFLQETLGAVLGVFYLVEAGTGLEPVATFGIEDPGSLSTVTSGRGFLAETMLHGRVKVLRGVEVDHGRVRTGLVDTTVQSLIVLPLRFDGQNLGLIELGRQDAVSESDLEFLGLVGETVAVALNTGRSRDRVNRLLKETWVQAENLSRHQKDLRETNRELAQADQYKSEFLANMSHELRTPLNSLLIMAQVLAENRSGHLNQEEVDSAVTIRKAGEDLLHLINDVLDLSRVDAGKLEVHIGPRDTVEVFKELEDLFRPVAADRQLVWDVLRYPDLPEVIHTDSLRLSQILRNILNNAFKFTESGGVTLVGRRATDLEIQEQGLLERGDCVVFEVSDTGIGMSTEVEAKIFEAFHQGDSGVGRRFGGSGLGLSISGRLVRILGGSIRVRSEEGKGSVFSLLLPVAPPEDLGEEGSHTVIWETSDAALQGPESPSGYASLLSEPMEEETPGPEADPPPAEPVPELEGMNILVCDDDMRTVFRLTEILEEAGCQVQLARTWQEALDLSHRETVFAGVILGTEVSDAPGGKPCRQWQEHCGQSAAPVLILANDGEGPEYPEAAGILERSRSPQGVLTLIGETFGRGGAAVDAGVREVTS